MSKFEREQVFKYPQTLICGYGIVGKHLKNEFKFAETYDLDVDMNADFTEPPAKHYDICFISVPTPNTENVCNTRFVEEALKEVDSDIYILKSTVPPTTTDELSKKYNKKILFSPEYFGATQFANAGNDFVILGGDDESYMKVRYLYELTKGSDFTIYHCSNTEAEIIKYMENSFLALKVIFCNQFKDIADLYGVSYSAIRDGFVLDKRVGKSHTFVYDDYRGYDSKCLNKDVPAFISAIKQQGFKDEFIMESVEKINNKYHKK